jgi:hypothetical protein
MCTISQKLKLCTCASTVDVYELDNYWVFYKYGKPKNYIIMGTPFFPYNSNQNVHENNLKQLPILLNEGQVFDVDLQPAKKDRLLLSIQLDSKNRFDYGFEYRNGKWKYLEYCFFTWDKRHDIVDRGEVR